MTTKQVLIIDDEPDIRELLELTLGRMNLDTRAAANLSEGRNLLSKHQFDLCLTDMRLPDGNGLEMVRHIQEHFPELPVAVITAFGNIETAVLALKAGAFDFVSKPVDINDLRNIVSSALKVKRVDNGSTKEAPEPTGSSKMLGDSPAMQKVRNIIEKLARGQAPVYVSGGSGTGKELAARLIHDLGPRADNPFVPINCGAIPEHLVESEFFGHKKGSFTGAIRDKEGLFAAADGGTLFLDEVGDLPLQMQVKLLRAIQEKTVRPVGSHAEIRVDVRVVSATHRDLAQMVEDGEFRQDLFYRLNVIELAMPDLKDRTEDIPQLVQNIVKRLGNDMGIDPPTLSASAIKKLLGYSFPGNVRELENILERALTLCEGDEINAEDLQLRGASASSATDTDQGLDADEGLDGYLARIERVAIENALAKTNQNKTAAAKLLGITFRALRYKLEKLEIE